MTEFKFIDSEIEYNGEQLTPHWIYKNFDIEGDAVVSFIGPCRVGIDKMVDLADVKNNDAIYSPRMLHFIAEFFEDSLEMMIYRQRLFIVILKEELEERAIPGRLVRKGDDIFSLWRCKRKKKTISFNSYPLNNLNPDAYGSEHSHSRHTRADGGASRNGRGA